ncbi:Crp/Fnr family transcriptional regulator [soil metagenome]
MNDKVKNKIDSFFTQFKKQVYKKGEILIRADENPSGIFYLKEGIVKEYAISKKGEELVVNIFKPGSFFPMSWGINETSNRYFFEAVDQVTIWKTPKQEAVAFLKQEPDVMYDLLIRLYRGTDGVLTRLVYLMSGSAYTRLITEILISGKRFGVTDKVSGKITCTITETELAAHAGLTRETVSREMKSLKDKRLVTLNRSSLEIPDISKLEEELYGDY